MIDDSPPWEVGTPKEGMRIEDFFDDKPLLKKPLLELPTETGRIVANAPPMPEKGKLIIVNKKTHEPTGNDYYCGRGSPLGNVFDFRGSSHPQVKYKVSSKEEAISSYEPYLRGKIQNKDPDICSALNTIYKMTKKGDVYLVCYCWPDDCHVRIIKKVIEEKIAKV